MSLILSISLLQAPEELKPRSPLSTEATERAAEAPDWNGFPVFVWREEHRGEALPDDLARDFGGTLLMRDEPGAWARERGLATLVFNAAGRSPLHVDSDNAWQERVERWIETHEESALVRSPCWNDPAVARETFATLAATLELHGDHPGFGFALGDEVSLTPNGDPFDLCRCEHCEAGWRTYARAHGLPERAPLTDEVRLGLLDDDLTRLGPWLARRRYDADQLRLFVMQLAGEVRVRSDAIDVGLLGLTGKTAFGGLDPSDWLDPLGFYECYPVDDARELFHSARRRQASLATLFPESESPAGCAWLVWDHWLRGGDGLVLWNDALLEKLPEQRARIATAVREVRELRSRFPELQLPVAGDAAVVHDADSIAASWLRDALLDGPTWPKRRASYQRQHGTRERKVASWLRFLEDAGLEARAIDLARIQGELPPLLILPEVLVIGEDDVRALEGILDKGAVTLVIDGRFGWVNRSGRAWGGDLVERLRKRAPERVLSAPAGLENYLVTRADPAQRERQAKFLLPWIPSRPFTVSGSAVPWRVSCRFTDRLSCFPGFARLYALLPNAPTAEERRTLAPAKLRIETLPGYAMEWVHPTDGEELEAGEAAVFLITPAAGEMPR